MLPRERVGDKPVVIHTSALIEEAVRECPFVISNGAERREKS
jgi:hypothetical protein